MPTIITKAFFSIDANQGNGAVDVSSAFEFDGSIFDDQRAGVSFNPVGALRQTELPGLINTTQLTGNYVPPDQSNQLYLDLIASWNDDATLLTTVYRPTSAAASSTNHQLTITGYLQSGPAAGLSHGDKIMYPVALFIQQVTHYDGTTTYTW